MNIPSPSFLRAGKAQFVVANPSGESLTVYVRLASNGSAYYVSARHQNHAWSYLGVLMPTNIVQRTPKATPDQKLRDIANWAIRVILTQVPLPAGYRLEHCGRCGVCGKLLRDPESIRLGIGPKCSVNR